MSQLKNDRLLRAIHREPLDRTPVWIMRQAGRYLPEYRAARQRAGSFMTLCKTPELACEVTLQPIERYDLDAAIIFSDILTIPDAMGLGLSFVEGKGPFFEHPTSTEQAIHRLPTFDVADLEYVYEAIRLVQKALANRLPLIGFCGSPWTLALYMIQGESKKGFPRGLKMMQEEPHLLHSLLNKLSDAVFLHLQAQIAAGVQVVMLFDTWASLLNSQDYEIFSLFYLKQIIKRLYNSKKIPVILFAKGVESLEALANSGCDVLGLDWTIDLKTARKRVGEQVALQGNMDPNTLLSSPASIQKTVSDILDSFGEGVGHIFNLGHGITPDVPPENVALLIETVHQKSRYYHKRTKGD